MLANATLALLCGATGGQETGTAGQGHAPPALTPVVATHYFYWYRWPTEHFDQPGAPGREGHTHHFRAPERVSYLDPDWHAAELRAMAACGIDVALPVYWGAPGAYRRPGIRFSRDGLGPMVTALDAIAAVGGKAPKLGLFYDTSTLLRSVRGVKHRDGVPDRPDLTEPAGRALFCDTVVEFFAAVPERHWGRVGDRPLVVVYVSGFASKWDRELGAALRVAFSERFDGAVPYLVADRSWGDIGQDRTTSWGAALNGPQLFDGVAQIGPGYDDTPVPGRRTPIRAREDGRFYAWSWRAAVVHRPELVLIETWNEMHEGTEICATIETGRRYLELTAEWIDRLRRGDPGPEIPAPSPLRPRPDLGWGAEARGADVVRADYAHGDAHPDAPRRFGLREIAWEDGPCAIEDGVLRSADVAADRVTYVYFQVSDHWRFDVDQDLIVEVEREADRDRTAGDLSLEYDSRDPSATLDGSYRLVRVRPSARIQNGAVLESFALPGARLANRQNGGADFRLVVRGGAVGVRAIAVR